MKLASPSEINRVVHLSEDEKLMIERLSEEWNSPRYELVIYDDIADDNLRVLYDKIMLYYIDEIASNRDEEAEAQSKFDDVFDSLGFPDYARHCWTYSEAVASPFLDKVISLRETLVERVKAETAEG